MNRWINFFNGLSVFWVLQMRHCLPAHQITDDMNTEKALSSAKSFKDTNHIAHQHLVLSIQCQNQGDYAKAAEYAGRSADIYGLTRNTEMQAYTLTFKANFLWHMGRLNESLFHLHQAMEMAGKKNYQTEKPGIYFFILQELAVVSQLYGRHNMAKLYFEATNKYYAEKKRYDELAANYIWLGCNAQDSAQYAAAGEYFRSAIGYSGKISHPQQRIDRLASAYNNLGCNEVFCGNYDEGIHYLKKAVQIHGTHLVGIDDSYYDLGDAYLQSGRPDQAAGCFQRSIRYNPDHWNSVSGLAKIAELRRDYAAADSFHRRAVEAAERRARFLEGRSIVAFFERVVPVYRDAARYYASRGMPEKCLETSERSKSRYLEYLTGLASFKITKGIDPRLLDSLNDLDRRIVTLYSRKGNDPDFSAVDDLRLQALELEKIAALKSMQTRFPEYHRLQEPARFDLLEIRKILGDRYQMLEFIVTRDSLTGIVIQDNGVHTKTLPVKYPELKNRIRDLIRSRSNLDSALFRLYGDVFLPFTPFLIPEKELVIIPDGILYYFPFEMLVTANPDGKSPKKIRYLVYDYVISYSPSASMFLNMLGKTNDTRMNYAGFAAEKYHVMDDLSHTSEQVHSAAERLAPGDAFTEPMSIKQHIFEKSADYKILDLAAHAVISDYDPMFSRIVFSDGPETHSDSLARNQCALHAYEIYNLDLHADLAVLSGCETGLGRYAEGEGMVGFNHAFTYAGANSLLMSHWPVDDESTLNMMNHFYSLIKDGTSKSKALQQAKINFLTNANELECDPSHWAAFTLWGNPDKIELRPGYRWVWISITGMALISVTGYLIFRRRNRRSQLNLNPEKII